MYNVIFYDKVKEVVETEIVIHRNYNEDGTYTDIETTQEVTKKYRVPTKFVFDTATNCDKLLQNFTVLDDFEADMPSINSAISMFENSSIISLKGTNGGASDFTTLNSGDYMFKNCKSLTSININASALTTVKGFVNNCSSLVSFSGSLESLIDGSDMFNSISTLTSFDASLNSLENGTGMFAFTSLPIFSIELPALETASEMFINSKLTSFDKQLPNLTVANSMFENCSELSFVNINCPLLENGDRMFNNTTIESIILDAPRLNSAVDMFSGIIEDGATINNLISFSGNLNSLIVGDNMFCDSALTTFDVPNLDNLESAENMMGQPQFESWNIEMPSLISGYNMFTSKYIGLEEYEWISFDVMAEQEGLTQITEDGEVKWTDEEGFELTDEEKLDYFKSRDAIYEVDEENNLVRYISKELKLYPALLSFESDLSSLTNGNSMFKECVNLKHFNAPLPSLVDGFDMFTKCKLDAESAMYIAESLPYYSEEEAQFITLGLNTSESDVDSFFTSTGLYSSFDDYKSRLFDKGWNLIPVYNPEN